MWINKDMEKLQPSAVRKILTMPSKRSDVINLGLGQSIYPTPSNIVEAGKKALDDGFTRYAPNAGLAVLREAIAEKVKKENGINATANDVFVTVGAQEALSSLFVLLLNPGDEVIIPEPCYSGYISSIAVARGVPVTVPLRASNDRHLDPKDLERAISPKTRVILFNTPNNPCGTVAHKEELEAIARFAIEHDLFVVTDEIYEKIIFDGRKHISLASLPGMAERTATINGFSKSYCMTGWRVGYFVMQNKLKEHWAKVQQALVSGANTSAQVACVEALTGPQEFVQEYLGKYDETRNILYEGINAITGVSCLKPEGTFYAMVNVSELGADEDVAMHLVENQGVRTIAASNYGPNGEGYLRLCFAVEPEIIKQGIQRIAEGAQELLAAKEK